MNHRLSPPFKRHPTLINIYLKWNNNWINSRKVKIILPISFFINYNIKLSTIIITRVFVLVKIFYLSHRQAPKSHRKEHVIFPWEEGSRTDR